MLVQNPVFAYVSFFYIFIQGFRSVWPTHVCVRVHVCVCKHEWMLSRALSAAEFESLCVNFNKFAFVKYVFGMIM